MLSKIVNWLMHGLSVLILSLQVAAQQADPFATCLLKNGVSSPLSQAFPIWFTQKDNELGSSWTVAALVLPV